jgi:hypothetical protein
LWRCSDRLAFFFGGGIFLVGDIGLASLEIVVASVELALLGGDLIGVMAATEEGEWSVFGSAMLEDWFALIP